jgi:hypothetical protein
MESLFIRGVVGPHLTAGEAAHDECLTHGAAEVAEVEQAG